RLYGRAAFSNDLLRSQRPLTFGARHRSGPLAGLYLETQPESGAPGIGWDSWRLPDLRRGDYESPLGALVTHRARRDRPGGSTAQQVAHGIGGAHGGGSRAAMEWRPAT